MINQLPILINTLRDRSFIFWSLVFPIFMFTVFNFAFSGLIKPDVTIYRVAVDANNQYIAIFKSIDILDVVPMDQGAAQEALESKQVIAYIDQNNDLLVMNNSMASTIVYSIVNQIKQTEVLAVHYRNFDFITDYHKQVAKQEENKAYYVSFYALMAMIGIYGAYGVLEYVTLYMANLSATGQRIEMARIGKFKLVISALVYSLLINFSANLIGLVYAVYVLKLPLIKAWLPSLLLILVLNIFGAALGLVIALSNRLSYQIKNSMITVTALVLSFMSGMMSISVRTMILEKAPFLAWLNPISMVTTALFRANALDDFTGYGLAISFILAISAAFIIISTMVLRRRKYVSL